MNHRRSHLTQRSCWIKEIPFTVWPTGLHQLHQKQNFLDAQAAFSLFTVVAPCKMETEKQRFMCRLFSNEPSLLQTLISPNSSPRLPLSATSSACDKSWITHYTFIADRLCMSTFIYILMITNAMIIHESQHWATPTTSSDGHSDPKCPWWVATIHLPGK